jgi:hypothetical protein
VDNKFWPPYPWNIDLLSMVFVPLYPWYLDPVPMVFWLPYPWCFEPPPFVFWYPIHGIFISVPLTMGKGLGIPRVVRAIYHGKRGQNIMYRRSKYHGYIMGNRVKIQWIRGSKYTSLCMVFWPPYQWYIEPPTYVISTFYPRYFDPLPISWLEIRGQNIMGIQFAMQTRD